MIILKLFKFVFYEDWDLRVCKDKGEAEKLFEQLYGFKVDGDGRLVEEIKEVDGYCISVVKI